MEYAEGTITGYKERLERTNHSRAEKILTIIQNKSVSSDRMTIKEAYTKGYGKSIISRGTLEYMVSYNDSS